MKRIVLDQRGNLQASVALKALPGFCAHSRHLDGRRKKHKIGFYLMRTARRALAFFREVKKTFLFVVFARRR